jgi:hypothetical protein
MVCLDISKAFDVVSHDLLLEMVSNSTLESNLVRWLKTYIRGRTAVCLFQGAVSKMFKYHCGMPQGSVLPPQLWNRFVSDAPKVAEHDESYADDFDLLECSPCVDELGRKLTEDLTHISEWAKKKEISIALEKSSVTLFTPDKHQSNVCLDVSYEDLPISVKMTVKYLGVNSNKHWAFSPHADVTGSKIKSSAQLLKATSGQDWGDKEVLRATFNAFTKPVHTHAAPIWYPTMGSDHSSIAKLQRSLNACFRIVTGAHRNSSVDHLLAETQMLSIKDQLNFIYSQFLASAFWESSITSHCQTSNWTLSGWYHSHP